MSTVSMSDPETSGRDTPRLRVPSLNRAETALASLAQQQGGHRGAARRRIVNAAHRVVDSVEKKNTYAYKNIDYNKQIRVLKIYPDRLGTTIACRLAPCPLFRTSFHDPSEAIRCTPYAALSYYWGEDRPKHRVYLFDTDQAYEQWKDKTISLRSFGSYFYIRDNLQAALEQLRSKRDPVYLWVDALCINQKHVEERTAQVAHMHEVYTHAEKVYIWLGEGKDDDNQKTFEFLNKILDLEKLEQHVERLLKKEESTWKEDLEDCKRAINLMKVDWFSRRWVIQELALATNAHVRRGRCEMPWPEFADAIALFMTKYDRIRHAFEVPRDYSASRNSDDHHMRALDAKALGANALVTATSNLFRRSNEGKIQQRLLSLELLVSSMLLAFEATDPKDTVFAVLQIAKESSIADPSAVQIRPIKGVKWIIIRYIVPLFGIILWEVDALTLLPSSASKSAILDISMINTGRGARTGIFIFINYCMLALSMLVIWMIYVMILDTVTNKYSKIMSGIRSGGSQVTKSVDKRIAADYQKCLRDVCTDFIEYCVENSKSLDILCRHWAPQQKLSPDSQAADMPSWIMPIEGHAFGGPKQLRKTRVNGDSFVGGSERRSNYTASGNLLPTVIFGRTKATREVVTEETMQEPGDYTKARPQGKKEYPPRSDGTMEVKGFQLDIIEESAPMIGPVISRAALELCGWSKETGSADIDQLWRILVANRGPDGTNAPTWYRRACKACLEWYNTQAEDLFNTNNLKNMEGTPLGKVEFLDRVQQVVWNRNLVRTRGLTGRQYIAVTPPKSQIYDIICILFGCSVPVVLRPVPDTGAFTFIGECYVHGVMDGEAVDPIPSGTKEQWFKLL